MIVLTEELRVPARQWPRSRRRTRIRGEALQINSAKEFGSNRARDDVDPAAFRHRHRARHALWHRPADFPLGREAVRRGGNLRDAERNSTMPANLAETASEISA
ncbi:hypothetical protein NKJ43_17005 [Mesorhizobium sp. M0138]